MKQRYKIASKICKFLPPLISQKTRSCLVSIKDAEKLNLDFKRKTFTGSYFEGNTSDFHAFKMSIHGYFDWRNVVIAKECLKKNPGVIIEVGANIGTETISFCDVAKKYSSSVVAFEPVPSNVESIIHNQQLNNIDNLELHTCLVADQKGKAFFNFPSGNNSGSGFIDKKPKDYSLQEYNVVTLDETINGKNVSFISVDVEGFEFQVLLGCKEILTKFQPTLIIEVNQHFLRTRGNSSVKEVYDFLKKFNYSCYYIETFGLKEVNVDEFVNKTNKNWLCIPLNNRLKVKTLNRNLLFYLLGIENIL